MSVVIVKIKGKEHTLRYGLPGCLEFEKQMKENPSTDGIIVTIALFYAGLFGEAARNGTLAPTYPEAYDIFEELGNQKDAQKHTQAMWDCYNSSVHGKDFKRRIDKANKAIEEEKKKMTKV